jgi:hypothetical protein
MVLGPRRSQRCPRSVEHIAGSRTEDSGRLRLNGLRVEEVDRPAAHVRTLREHLAVHDRVGPESYGGRRWTTMSSGKPGGQARSDIETIGSGSEAAS